MKSMHFIIIEIDLEETFIFNMINCIIDSREIYN